MPDTGLKLRLPNIKQEQPKSRPCTLFITQTNIHGTISNLDSYSSCPQTLLTSRRQELAVVPGGHLVDQMPLPRQAWVLRKDAMGSIPLPKPMVLEAILTGQRRRSAWHSSQAEAADPGNSGLSWEPPQLFTSLPSTALASFVPLLLFPLEILTSHLVKHHVEGFVEFPQSVDHIRVDAGVSPTLALA